MPKVLGCDDDPVSRTILAKCLRQIGCEVVEATNGVECLEAARREKPDLILLDVMMSVMDGLQVLNEMRQDPELRSIPVIMLTAVAHKDLVVEIIKLGVRDYIVKPFDRKELQRKVNRVLRLWEGDGPPLPAAAAAESVPFDRPKVLVIDDSANVLQSVIQALKGTCEVRTASNGPDGVAIAAEQRPDMILVDLAMPRMGGIEILRRLRSSPNPSGAVIIGLSIQTAIEEHAAAREAGYDGILTKPFTADELRALLPSPAGPSHFLTLQADVHVLSVPDRGDARLSPFLQFIASDSKARVRSMAEQAFSKLVIDLSKVSELDPDLLPELTALASEAQALKIRVRFVTPAPSAQPALARHEAARSLPMAPTLEAAMRSFDQPEAPAAAAS
jgi:two-component system cell cycle response regulator